MVSGAAVLPPRLADALFLTRHPGWSWDDLQSAPSDVVRMMRLIDTVRAEVSDKLGG